MEPILHEKKIVGSTTPKIPHLLHNVSVHFRVHKNMPVVPIWRRINPVHILLL
jgi:hypothetical protein